MKHGHATGARRHRSSASDWYAAIERATLAQLDATWPQTTPTPQEVTHDLTQEAQRSFSTQQGMNHGN